LEEGGFEERQERLQPKDVLWSIRVMVDFKESRLCQWSVMNKLGAIKVRERIWQEGNLVKDEVKEVCESEKTQPVY